MLTSTKRLSFLASLLSAAVLVTSAQAKDTLKTGEVLKPGQTLFSKKGQFALAFQKKDGNVVLYQKTPGAHKNRTALWDTKTWSKNAKKFVLQGDGNLVVYSGAGHPIWSPNIHGKGGVRLIVQNDGNLVLYTSKSKPVWHTGTVVKQTKPNKKTKISNAHCDLYANEAIKLSVKAATIGMGFSGPRWSQQYKDHYKFCKSGVPPQILFAEHEARVHAIKMKTPASDPLLDLLGMSLNLVLKIGP